MQIQIEYCDLRTGSCDLHNNINFRHNTTGFGRAGLGRAAVTAQAGHVAKNSKPIKHYKVRLIVIIIFLKLSFSLKHSNPPIQK